MDEEHPLNIHSDKKGRRENDFAPPWLFADI
jgi:hypothetical protein